MKVSAGISKINGEVFAPSSKSYTHRAIAIASLSEECVIHRPLLSADTLATVRACEAFGARVDRQGDRLVVHGFRGKPNLPDNVIDVANSGTTLRFKIGRASCRERV